MFVVLFCRASLAERPMNPVEDYVGTFGRFAYGNLTVFSEGHRLFFSYGNLGQFRMFPTTTPHYFIPIGRNRVSLIYEIDFIFFFSSPGELNDHLRLGTPETPVFFRDSSFSNAPAPPDPQC